jgi:glycerophosphoryl diester phosphodiesterase
MRKNKKPLIFIHRGCELPRGGKLKAILGAADYIELDVRKTADDILVVSHHRSLKNTVRRVLVDKNSYSELVRKTGKKLAILEDIVEELSGKIRFNLDLKQEGYFSHIKKFIKRHKKIENEVIIDSCYYKELERLAEEFPKAKFAYSFNYKDKRGLESFRIVKGLAYLGYFAFFPLWPRLLKQVAKRKPLMPAASIFYRVANKGIVKYFHDRSIKVYVWPVNRESAMRRMIDLGVDGIKTSKPELLKRILKNDS